jgi:hypothetical protein
MTNTLHMSNQSVATSYEQELLTNPRVFVGVPERSPYFLNTTLSLPKYVLTKTHCSGLCEQCAPEWSLETFEKECLTLYAGTNRKQHIYYGHAPAKAIHLIRSPFDNLVARMVSSNCDDLELE